MKGSKIKNKRKVPFWIEHAWLVTMLGILGFLALLCAIIFFVYSPQTFFIRKTPIYVIIMRCVISGVILFFTFYRTGKMPKHCKVMLVLASMMPWYSLFISSYRVLRLLQLITVHLLLADFIYMAVIKCKNYNVLTFTALILYLVVLTTIYDYSFINSNIIFRFWKIITVLTVISAAAFGWLAFKNKTKIKFKGAFDKGATIFVAFIIAFGINYCLIHHLNYALDMDTPELHNFEIVEKRIDGGGRRPTRYIVVAERDSEQFELDVTECRYMESQVGDTIEASLYNGFFNEAFYIVE